MKNKAVRLTAVLLSVTLLLGICSLAGCAKKEEKEPEKQDEIIFRPDSDVPSEGTGTPAKDETVYVLADAGGIPDQVIVSSWLKNPAQNEILLDSADLQNIENVKGTEEYEALKNHGLQWNAMGKDIYYQGTTEKELPVDVKVTWTLDGKTAAPEELAGKSGRLTIRFDYENNAFADAEIRGKQEKIHVPFIAVTGLLLDTDIFSNVEVVNGQMENMGETMAVAGFAFPGLQENLNLDKETLNGPDYIEITADVKNFEMGPSMTVVTTSLLKNLNAEDLDIQELKDQAEKLTDGMDQLLDGAGQLSEGLDTLLDQTEILADGVGKLSSGAAQLKTGTDKLTAGVSMLESGAAQLNEGLGTLSANSATLNAGAKQVFNTLLSSATTQLKAAGISVPALTIGNYAKVLNGVIASLDKNAVYESALQQVTAGVNAQKDQITAAVTAEVGAQVTQKVTAQAAAAFRETVRKAVEANREQFRAAVIFQATGLTTDQYDAAVAAGRISPEQQAAVNQAVQAAMDAETAKQMEAPENQAKLQAIIEENVKEQMASPEIQALIAENVEKTTEKIISETMASPEIQAKLQAAAEGAKSVIALKTSLDSYNGFYLGLTTYTAGVDSATAGSAELIGGIGELKAGIGPLGAGAGELSSGIHTIDGKMPDLLDGITALRDGSRTLKSGLSQLMEEGIQKISDLAEEDLDDLVARLAACIKAGNSYDTFSGKLPEAEGTVKFIYKTDSVSLEEQPED